MTAPATPRLAVLVSGPTEAAVRRFLARYVKKHFGLPKNQWRMCYRKEYALVVLSRPLKAGEDAAARYGRYAASGALVLACLAEGVPGSGRAAARAWLKARGFDPVVELVLGPGGSVNEDIDQGAEVVNFVNHNCPWRSDPPVDDLEAYLAKNSRPLWT